VTPRVARANRLAEPRGVLVFGGPEGLRGWPRERTVDGRAIPVGGDVVVGLADTTARSHEDLMRALLEEGRPGEPVSLRVLRDGTERTVSVVPDERPQPDGDWRGGTHVPVERRVRSR